MSLFGRSKQDMGKAEAPTATVSPSAAQVTQLQFEVDQLTQRRAHLEAEIRDAKAMLESLAVSADDQLEAEQQYSQLTNIVGSRQLMVRSIDAQLPQLTARLAGAKEAYRKAEWERLGAEIEQRAEHLAGQVGEAAQLAKQIDDLAVQRLTFSHKAIPYHDGLFSGAAAQLAGLAVGLSPAAHQRKLEKSAANRAQFEENLRKKLEENAQRDAVENAAQRYAAYLAKQDSTEWA